MAAGETEPTSPVATWHARSPGQAEPRPPFRFQYMCQRRIAAQRARRRRTQTHPGCGAHSRHTARLPPLSAAAPVGSRQPPDPFIFPFFFFRRGAGQNLGPSTHTPPLPKAAPHPPTPLAKGVSIEKGTAMLERGIKIKRGRKEGGGLGNLGAERGKHAECPHLGSAFEAASFGSEQDIFKVQLEVCVYPGHLAGISWRQRRPRCAPLRCAAPPAEPGRPKPAGRARSLFIGRGERDAAAGPHRFIRSGPVSAAQPAAPSPPSLFPCVAGGETAGDAAPARRPPVRDEARARPPARRLKGKGRAEEMAPPCDRAALALPALVGKPAALGTPLPLPSPRRRADGCGPIAADQPPPPRAARPWGLSAASRPKLCRLVEGRPLPGKLLMEVRACRVLPQALVPQSLLVIRWQWRLRVWPSSRDPLPPGSPELVPNVTAEQSTVRR